MVPVFSEYARPERRGELARVAGAVLTLIALVMALCMVVLLAFAGPVADLLGDFADPELQIVLANSLRILSPAVVLFGISGGVTALLYAQKRFNYAAVGATVFNLGIVIMAPLLAGVIGVYALALGIVAGSLLQLAVLLPGLAGFGVRLSLAWNHPAVRRILYLYLPIAIGLVASQIQIGVDRRWASAAGEQSAGWMRYATTLIQLPLGLIPVAISLAALPSLSQRAGARDWEGFRRLFAGGLRWVIVLLIPATVGLWVLAEPLIRLLFEHRRFVPYDTTMTAQALRFYLLGLPFAGIDYLLNYAFYALAGHAHTGDRRRDRRGLIFRRCAPAERSPWLPGSGAGGFGQAGGPCGHHDDLAAGQYRVAARASAVRHVRPCGVGGRAHGRRGRSRRVVAWHAPARRAGG